MKLRSLVVLALVLGAIVTVLVAGTWGLGRLLPRAVRPKTPLAQAALDPGTQRLRRELEIHPLTDPHDGRGEEAMVWASRTGRGEAIVLLARAGAPVSFRDQGPNGWQPLHHAVHKNEAEGVRALLAAGAEVDGTNPDGLTPLMLAASQGEGEIAEILLAAGADPRKEGPEGRNALAYALFGGDLRTVRGLLARAPDLPVKRDLEMRAVRVLLRLRGRGAVLKAVDDRPEAR